MAKTQDATKSYIDHDGKRPHPGALHFMDRFRNFPCPLLNLQPTPMHHRNERSLDCVTLLGDDETKILTADNYGHTVLFDAASYSVVHFPKLNCSKGYDAMAVSINRAAPQEPDCLYVLNLRTHPTTSNHCFEVLSYGGFCERIPIWRFLPPPPFTTTTQTTITSYTVVGGDTIYVSSKLCGTHAFDTLDLISLGSGRFCVAKMFSSMMQDDEIDMEFAVLTGLQMLPPRGTKDDQQVPWMPPAIPVSYQDEYS
uniref:DUF295 domain-containing protein n=1 Tax=Oryza sativa subsp. japonica TaxID=39947 RepID=Q2QYM7_ORYSJ|nr:hypothetical protein LOC_Os12g02160 [Oryza sativa Japonica Group]